MLKLNKDYKQKKRFNVKTTPTQNIKKQSTALNQKEKKRNSTKTQIKTSEQAIPNAAEYDLPVAHR